jgi:predicted O-linked N-acetylglucosamine transferase (SPINDLY family)
MPAKEAARLIQTDAIDLLIDLTGYTQYARTQIPATRPAPVQVNFLGYPGTMGADFIDYIIADSIVVPMDQQPFFTEKIVHLPGCYLPGGGQRRISETTPSRGECGLPETGFVFCGFNNSFKITPDIFDIWMRLLRLVPESVLWLRAINPTATNNLRREAEARGVDKARLIFAPKLASSEDHLARHCLADLFLDTLPYNAHSTAADALWMGLPVLTCVGSTFAGRVAGSLLHAAGLPELATTTLTDYESIALRLATDPALLAGLRQRLEKNRPTAALFDGAVFVHHLELAFQTMWQRHSKGLSPESFAVFDT